MPDTADDRTRQVLMVDDDARLQDVVREFLEKYGYAVASLESGKGLAETLDAVKPDIVLLDVMLPGDDGFTLLRDLRAHSRIPVIMLTACGDSSDRIIGLEIGADDYLPKPFNPRELLARIKAVLRRVPEAFPPRGEGPGANGPNGPAGTNGPDGPGGPENRTNVTAEDASLLRAGPYILDMRRQRLVLAGKDGTENAQDLSTTEYRILQAFMSRPGEVLSRERVLSLVFGDDHYVCDRNIDVYISRIRSLLRKLGDGNVRIRTVWGSGYAWVEGE